MKFAPSPAMWNRIGTRFLPFADVATPELPLSRLLRLSLFQVSVGMCAVLLTGTLNRVMIVELGLHASVVAAMVSLPLLFAPLRALVGHKSDHHRSLLGWKRVPYLWFGTLLQFGGMAVLPFALLVMSGRGDGSALVGEVGAAIGFLMVGAGMHTVQTAGLALATDLSTEENAPRVVALLYVMLLIGMMVSALVLGQMLTDFTPTHLVQVVQGVAALTVLLNLVALWKQEARQPRRSAEPALPAPAFKTEWRAFVSEGRTARLLVAIGLGAAAFAMQDVLLEPYGGQVIGLTIAATTTQTALWAVGTLAAFALAARLLGQGAEPHRLAGFGAVIGIVAFMLVIFAAPGESAAMMGSGAALLGFGGGLFSVATMTAIMDLSAQGRRSGLALGAWGAVGASSAGVAILIGGLVRDVVGGTSGYIVVFVAEIILLVATLVAVGPLVAPASRAKQTPRRFGMADFPA